MFRIRKDDQVMVIAGKEKGKTGRVKSVVVKDSRVIVENVNLAKKAMRKTQKDPNGGIREIELPIHISNLMLVDKKRNKPTRFGVSILKDGSRSRISRKSNENI